MPRYTCYNADRMNHARSNRSGRRDRAMTLAEELAQIADDMFALRDRYYQTELGAALIDDARDRLSDLIAEAYEAITPALGKDSSIANSLLRYRLTCINEEIYLEQVADVSNLLRSAARQVGRQHRSEAPTTASTKSAYVDASRIDALVSVKGKPWDTTRLVQMCRELNVAHENECHISVAMLVRGILDHVPPAFGKKSFGEVASNHGGKSFKGSMKHLDDGARNIADGHLHQQMRAKESVPTATQVDFKQSLDVLLDEIVRLGS